jgi:hypothetical protein
LSRLADIVAARYRLFATALILVSMALFAPAMRVGLASDDYIQKLRMVPGSTLAGFEWSPFDSFTFATGDVETNRAVMQEGTFSWWADPELKLSFWRPLSSLSHYVDFTLFPARADLMAAHSIVWFGALLVVLAALFRRLHTPGLALFALAVFALDDVHGSTIGFISNRNAAIAATLGMFAVLMHDRWRRDGFKPGAVLGPLAFGLSMLAGEASIATLGYLGAHALAFERGNVVERLKPLLGYLGVFAAWMFAYKAGGYGAHGSGVYLDPVSDIALFLPALAERLPVLLLGQYGLPFSDFWVLYPQALAQAVVAFATVALLGGAWLLWPLLRTRPELRFWALGSLAAAVPVCATFPADRLLMFVGIGAAPQIVALIVAPMALRRPAATAQASVPRAGLVRRATLWSAAVALVIVHCVLGPLMLPLRAASMQTVNNGLALFDGVVPEDAGVASKTVVLVSAPTDGLVGYLPLVREAQGRPRPARQRLLSTSSQATEVVRTDANTLRITPENGLFELEGERMLRGADLPFTVGEAVDLGDMRVTVLSLTDDGRPASIEARFSQPLESPDFVWLSWDGAGFAPFELPAVGAAATVPAVDGAALVERLLKP